MNILIINGPNLNRLGIREPDIYGSKTYDDLCNFIMNLQNIYNVKIEIQQSNLEGILIDLIHYGGDSFDAVILNAGAFTHYSYALYDAIKSISIPVVEVHLTDINNREAFRKISVIRDACITNIMGLGFEGYVEAIKFLLEKSESK